MAESEENKSVKRYMLDLVDLSFLVAGGVLVGDGVEIALTDVGFDALRKAIDGIERFKHPVAFGKIRDINSDQVVGVMFGDKGELFDSTGAKIERATWANLESGLVVERIKGTPNCRTREYPAPLKFVRDGV